MNVSTTRIGPLEKRILLWAAVLAGLFLLVEVCLRLFLGLGSPPLVYASTDFGYAFRPNQSNQRFGHRISYNGVGLRSEELRPLTGESYRILCLGGAITNGGAPTDQKDTYPYQLEQILKQKGENPQVLNASAGGWTLTNEAAFLQDKGTFDAKFVVLEGGTRELYQGSDLKSLDGADPNLPGHRPPTAINELFDRYLLPKIYRRLGMSAPESEPIWNPDSMTEENYQRGLAAMKTLVESVIRHGAKPIILLVLDKEEALQGGYRADHRQDLSDLAAEGQGQLVEVLPIWHAQLAEGHELFRDDVHPNPQGNRIVAQALSAAVSR